MDARTLNAMLWGMYDGPPQTITVKDKPQYTTNLFGPIDEIAGKQLRLLERNRDGHCLCIFTGRDGQNLIDVDRRDIDNKKL